MSFSATFYSFSKRLNSTKQPGGGSEYQIILKHGCSIIRPTISLDVGQAGNPTGYNYCYIPAFNRFYYASDWVFENRLWTASLRADALASFKTGIGASNCYVARSASSYNSRVVDNYYPALASNTHSADIITSPFDKDNGCYVVGIQGKGSGGNGGAVTYYKATDSGLKTLVNYMLNDASIYSQSDISDDLLKCIFNPLQYIVSCMWFPFDVPTTSGSPTFGWWDANISGISPISSLEWGTNFSFSIPKHPKSSRGAYLNLPPFASYRLEAGPWGIIPLDNFNLLDEDTLSCDYKVDLMTGSGRLNIKFRDALIYENIQTTQIGVPVQLGQNVLNQGALVGSIGNSAALVQNALTGNVAGMLTSGISAIGDAAALTQSVPSSIGSNGTRSFNNIFGLMADFLDIADEDIQSRGRPLCAARTISTLSGYIQCIDADPAIACTDTELSEIIGYMNSGFFYE